MDKKLYRKQSFEQLEAAPKIDTYLKVVNLSGWLVLLAIILVLIGCAVWALSTKWNT